MPVSVQRLNGRTDRPEHRWVVLPGGVSGPQAAAKARRERPDLKVLFTSGYPEKDVEELTVGGVDVAILRKPYLEAELAEAIAKALQPGET